MRGLVSVLTCVMLVGAASAQSTSFDPVGRWRLQHGDGTPFISRLMPDKTATTDFGAADHGIWRHEGAAVRMIFTDGWDDLLVRGPDGRFVKRAWGPDADRCGPPTSTGPAEHLSGDPGPPFKPNGNK